MKVYISVDMEGIAGVIHSDHTGRGNIDYELARELMTNEANAAIKGALQAGATDILVNDSHGTMRNIYPHLLRKEAKLISGTPKKLGMMEGISKVHDAAVLIGYHTRSMSQGVLNHTYSSKVIHSIDLNGEPFGEFGINSLVAGSFDVPVVFVSGCNLTINEAKEHVPNIYSTQVKQSINRVSTESLHPELACDLITKDVEEALRDRVSIKPYQLKNDSYTMEITFVNTLYADAAATLPFVEQINPLCIKVSGTNIKEMFLILRSLIMMASSVD